MYRNYWRMGLILGVVIIVLALSSGLLEAQEPTSTPMPTSGMSGMGPMETEFSSDDLAPLVRGIYEGDEVFFIHTEVSDPAVAEMLSVMMGPQVVTVPSLADVPEVLLGRVYVFTNGIEGGGPMGFQPDIFDSVPGDETYTPLRMVNLVTWQADTVPHMLDSVGEIETAEAAGEVTVEQPGIVVNMPILVWPGGHR
jgi:hypothetical protein